MKTILVTGATGFVGTYLIEHLLQNECKIVGTSLSEHQATDSRVEIIALNLLDGQKVDEVIRTYRPDEVYHLAALTSPKKSFENPAETITNNITAEVHILESLAKNNLPQTKVLIVSSADIYGLVDAKYLPINENTPLNPTNPYAVSKIAQDFLGLQYFYSHKLHIIRVRPFNHIGPGQSPQFVVSAFAKRLANIEKGKLDVLTVGNLGAKRDFTDVRDMVIAYTLILEKGKAGEVYNIGSGVSYTVSEILDMLLSLIDRKITVQQDPNLLMPADNPELICDATKMKQITGWKPAISLQQTVKDILDYWRSIE